MPTLATKTFKYLDAEQTATPKKAIYLVVCTDNSTHYASIAKSVYDAGVDDDINAAIQVYLDNMP